MKVLRKQDRIRSLGGEAVFIVHDEPDVLREGILEDLDPPSPILIDLERRTYRGWGLRRASWWEIYLDPQVWRTYARLLLGRGEQWRPKGRDPLQLGGDFVVAPDGTLAYARPQERDDRPAVGELVEVMERTVGT